MRKKQDKKRKEDEAPWRMEKALEILREHPEWSNNRVGVEMVRLGYVKDRGYLNKRLWWLEWQRPKRSGNAYKRYMRKQNKYLLPEN